MHHFLKTIDYLTEFFTSNYPGYFEIMKDAGNSHYPPVFEGESEIIQGIRNTVGNIEDNYSDLTIPKGFASPNLLHDSLVGFRDMAERQLLEAQSINKKLGEPWFDVISHSIKINNEVMEAINYALTLKTDEEVVASLDHSNNKEKDTSISVDIKDLSVGDLIKSVKRLKISSAIWIVSSIIILIVASYGAGVSSKLFASKTPVFTPLFTESFVDKEHLLLLLPEILEETPDGIETDAEAMASLLWQVKAQDGYAEFLVGKKFTSVQITYSDNSFKFEWKKGNSAIPKILNRLSLPADDNVIAQLNAEMNLIGVSWLPENNQIVRDIDGGLSLVGKE
jgi:hypothetical protein